jgi:hypothetical protein
LNNIYLTRVGRASTNAEKPRIVFFAEWMRDMGFVPNALVQFLPEKDGALCILRNENIASYSELFNETMEKGGTFILPRLFRHRDYPCIHVSGGHVKRAGMKYGDNLIVRYEYGRIHIRKLPDGNIKIVTARIFGPWLEAFGFAPGESLTVGAEPGTLVCTLHENGVGRAAELVKYARANRLNLIQVRHMADNNYCPIFEVPPSRLEVAGFRPDDALLATYSHGFIKLQKPDFIGLGF